MNTWNSLWGTDPPFLAPKHRYLLLTLLQRHVPDRTVWAFGSRATGKYLRRFSDLDLAVEHSLPSQIRSDLLEALDDSDLPVKVDLVELDRVDAAFAARIRPDFVALQVSAPPASQDPGAMHIL